MEKTPIFACHLLFALQFHALKEIFSEFISFSLFDVFTSLIGMATGEKNKRVDCWHEHVVDVWKLEKMSVVLKRCSARNYTNNHLRESCVFFGHHEKGAKHHLDGKNVEHNFASMRKRKLNWFRWSKMQKKERNKEYYFCRT